jgi:NADPH:quinone reductase-like Zn-dependent oxidoreductase/NAD(P)-dependent dehydrogenase (short-subunit alcohol dehydrogenase family)/acyl carrier protein
LGYNEICVKISVSGLNFRDIVNILGMAGDLGSLGGEFSGEVYKIGENIRDSEIGEIIFGIGMSGCFSSHTITYQDLVLKKPDNITIQEAATIPVTFLTVFYGLNYLAEMKKDSCILVHAASGGVGLAAIQVAKKLNAVIIGSAGRKEKRHFAQSWGTDYTVYSRSSKYFSEKIMQISPDGVDIVLNSLTGDFITNSVSILKDSDTSIFLEIGKVGIWSKEEFSQLKKKARYSVFDIAVMFKENGPLIKKMLKEISIDLEEGIIHSLPYQNFPMEKAIDAFRFMSTGKHIGKLLLSNYQYNEENISPPSSPSSLNESKAMINDNNPKGVYLITGGFSGIGLLINRWIVMEKNIRNMILVGRSGNSMLGVPTIIQNEEINNETSKKLRNNNDDDDYLIEIICIKSDISTKQEVQNIILEMNSNKRNLIGIFHCAAVVQDGLLENLKWSSFVKVLTPKVKGAWNLHKFTMKVPIECFVLFSSIASMLGSPGQGNYATSNAFLDGFAHYRKSQGLNAITINWGPWAEIGMLTRLTVEMYNRMEQYFYLITPTEGLDALNSSLFTNPYIYGGEELFLPTQIGVFNFKKDGYNTFISDKESFILDQDNIYQGIHEYQQNLTTQGIDKEISNSSEFLKHLEQIPFNDRNTFLNSTIERHVNKILARDSTTPIDLQQPLTELGMESLMALEFKNSLEKVIGESLPATLIYDYPTIESLTEYIMKEFISNHLTSVVPILSSDNEKSQLLDDPTYFKGEKRIGIIGVGCRFPCDKNQDSTPNLSNFWKLLDEGIDTISEIPLERWNINEFYDPNPETPGKMYTRFASILGDVDKFDANFFGIAPREAKTMDPQQRLLLEVTWESLENAFIVPITLHETQTAVFIGISSTDYIMLRSNNEKERELIDAYRGTGSSLSVNAGRISYTFGLKGPSMVIDTACSSSLVATHLAYQTLNTKESDFAIVGGVNLTLSPETTIGFSKAHMLSEDGKCKSKYFVCYFFTYLYFFSI